MTRSPSCRRLIWDWVEPWIPLGLSFVELWWCSCMRASPCWRRDAAVPRTPPTFWWRTWWMCAVEPWAGGALAGLWLMANRMAMASLEPTVSLALAFTQGTRPAEWSHPWNAPLMAASRPCWVGSFNGPFARPVPPLWAGQWLSVSRAPPMPPRVLDDKLHLSYGCGINLGWRLACLSLQRGVHGFCRIRPDLQRAFTMQVVFVVFVTSPW